MNRGGFCSDCHVNKTHLLSCCEQSERRIATRSTIRCNPMSCNDGNTNLRLTVITLFMTTVGLIRPVHVSSRSIMTYPLALTYTFKAGYAFRTSTLHKAVSDLFPTSSNLQVAWFLAAQNEFNSIPTVKRRALKFWCCRGRHALYIHYTFTSRGRAHNYLRRCKLPTRQYI